MGAEKDKVKTGTQKPSLKALVEATSIPATLVRAVVRQMGGWKSFTQAAPDICRGGIDGGFTGFIYTADTWDFTKRNRVDIAAMASEQAKEFGASVTEMIQGFGCFRHDEEKPTDEQIGRALYTAYRGDVSNALAWYAGEEVARAYCDVFDPR